MVEIIEHQIPSLDSLEFVRTGIIFNICHCLLYWVRVSVCILVHARQQCACGDPEVFPSIFVNEQIEIWPILECVEFFKGLGDSILQAYSWHVEFWHLRNRFERIISLQLISDPGIIDLSGHLRYRFEPCLQHNAIKINFFCVVVILWTFPSFL